MTIRTILVSTSLALLSACGGGGDGGPATSTTPADTNFSLGPAYRAMAAGSATNNYNVTGGCGGTSTQTASAPVAGTFEGAPALVKTTTSVFTLTGCTGSGTTTGQTFYDSAYRPLGGTIPNVLYSKFQAQVNVPEVVKLNDTGILGTQTVWSSSAKTTVTGGLVHSYVVESDSATSVIVKLITRSFNASNVLQFTETDSFRLSGGTLTDVGTSILYANGLSLVLTPR